MTTGTHLLATALRQESATTDVVRTNMTEEERTPAHNAEGANRSHELPRRARDEANRPHAIRAAQVVGESLIKRIAAEALATDPNAGDLPKAETNTESPKAQRANRNAIAEDMDIWQWECLQQS